MNTNFLAQLLVNGMIVGALYGVVAMSFVLIYKATKVVNFAQGEFLLIGAWVCWSLVANLQLPFLVGLGLTLLGMFVFGVVLQIVLLRPLVGEPIISVIMATIGLSIFLQALAKWIFGTNPQSFPDVFAVQTLTFAGVTVSAVYAASLVASLLIMTGFAVFFRFSRMGIAMRATAYDQQAAQSTGVSVQRVFASAWAISAVVSTVAGVTIGLVNGVSSSLAHVGIKVFPAVILGGLDSVAGAVIGGLTIGILENLAHYFDTQFLHWGSLHQVAPFYVLIIVLMIRPYGLFGTKDIERV